MNSPRNEPDDPYPHAVVIVGPGRDTIKGTKTIVMDPDCALCTDEHLDTDGTFQSTHNEGDLGTRKCLERQSVQVQVNVLEPLANMRLASATLPSTLTIFLGFRT